ncbi:MAG: hypothetical protein C0440_00020 [Candidatus Pelagibacter sp.]|nr:hypothetical protein [Candidatus Pelagibacter sp.]
MLILSVTNIAFSGENNQVACFLSNDPNQSPQESEKKEIQYCSNKIKSSSVNNNLAHSLKLTFETYDYKISSEDLDQGNKIYVLFDKYKEKKGNQLVAILEFNPEENSIYVAFRGTASLRDAIVDAGIMSTSKPYERIISNDIPAKDNFVHGGFFVAL